jgi:hypothetical protein
MTGSTASGTLRSTLLSIVLAIALAYKNKICIRDLSEEARGDLGV